MLNQNKFLRKFMLKQNKFLRKSVPIQNALMSVISNAIRELGLNHYLINPCNLHQYKWLIVE